MTKIERHKSCRRVDSDGQHDPHIVNKRYRQACIGPGEGELILRTWILLEVVKSCRAHLRVLKNTGCKKRADHFLEGAFFPSIARRPTFNPPSLMWVGGFARGPAVATEPGEPAIHAPCAAVFTNGGRTIMRSKQG